ncbi:SPP1 family predicted phage head-tail adaptor [Paenibacillus sp. BK033]|uniref:phage head closure protein n=1 Tax=Paenibacillus sp. BK033 TaxID=2512133 RepID=UPI00104E1DBA|nr:phage head closure protein [Paenibacillus sp. BK033]TCN00858.1 SPP1 family predicted phage head-tail adaptor [Paenibacillus sp. BK033]
MTYDYELTLIGETISDDNIGNQIAAETPTVILCGLKSVARNEFYNAAANGLRPERVFVIHNYEYSAEQLVEFEGERYKVIRSYAVGSEELELTCEKVLGNG